MEGGVGKGRTPAAGLVRWQVRRAVRPADPHVIATVMIGLFLASTGLMPHSPEAPSRRRAGRNRRRHRHVLQRPCALPHRQVAAAAARDHGRHAGPELGRRVGACQLDRPCPGDASLGMVAGGSAAIVGAAEDLAADARITAVMQYLRLVLVVLAMPPLIRFAFASARTARPASQGDRRSLLDRRLGVPALGRASRLPARQAAPRLPSAALLGPVILASVVTVAGVNPPAVAREVAFDIIGLEGWPGAHAVSGRGLARNVRLRL